MNRKAEIRINGIRAGMLTEGQDEYIFQYDSAYAETPGVSSVSLLMPLRAEPYRDKRMFPFFDGLIPEGWLLDIAEKTWKLDPRDRMGLLMACCRDCIGDVEVIPLEDSKND